MRVLCTVAELGRSFQKVLVLCAPLSPHTLLFCRDGSGAKGVKARSEMEGRNVSSHAQSLHYGGREQGEKTDLREMQM